MLEQAGSTAAAVETFLSKHRLSIPRYDSAFRVAFELLRESESAWVNSALPQLESVISTMGTFSPC